LRWNVSAAGNAQDIDPALFLETYFRGAAKDAEAIIGRRQAIARR
jgi:hypothetical protein